ncbi:MAG: hypothetical protein V3S03_03300 [Vicinamibacteria bacterium]
MNQSLEALLVLAAAEERPGKAAAVRAVAESLDRQIMAEHALEEERRRARSRRAGGGLGPPMRCRYCLCSELDPCVDGAGVPCWWALPEVCSMCLGEAVLLVAGGELEAAP